MKHSPFNPLHSVAMVNIVTFLGIVAFIVVPIAYFNMRATENDLVEALSGRLGVIAQRSAQTLDTLQVASLADPKAIASEPHIRLVGSLNRIQRDFQVDNAVVYRYDGAGQFVYVADGNDWFDIGAPVALHERFPATYAAAMEAWETGHIGDTRLFRSGRSEFYQVNVPLKLEGKVVGILMLNDDATSVADEISKRHLFILISVLIVIGIEMVVSWLLTTGRVRPLLRLRDCIREIVSGNLNVEVPTFGRRNEIALLLESFRELVGSLRREREAHAHRERELTAQLDSVSREAAALREKLGAGGRG